MTYEPIYEAAGVLCALALFVPLSAVLLRSAMRQRARHKRQRAILERMGVS